MRIESVCMETAWCSLCCAYINFNYSGFWFPVPASRFRIPDSRFQYPDFKFRMPCFRVAAGFAVPLPYRNIKVPLQQPPTKIPTTDSMRVDVDVFNWWIHCLGMLRRALIASKQLVSSVRQFPNRRYDRLTARSSLEQQIRDFTCPRLVRRTWKLWSVK